MADVVLDPLRRLARKPVGAAFLSFLFPGLGQAAAGQAYRGFLVAIPALAAIGTIGLIVIFDRSSIFNLALNQQMLTNLLIVDIVGFVYHTLAVVDAYLVARRMASVRERKQFGGRRPSGRPNRGAMRWAAALAVCTIVTGNVVVHGAVAKVDMDWQHALYCLTAKIPCWVSDNPVPDPSDGADPSGIAETSDEPGPLDSGLGSLTPMPTYDINSIPTFSVTTDSQNWDADGELNILLAGIGVQKGASANDLGVDSIMVIRSSIHTGQAELISVPRNSYCTPLPTQEIARNYPTNSLNCPAGTWAPIVMGLPNEILRHCEKWPIPEFASTCGQKPDENRYIRAYKGFEMSIGTLLGIHIDGSIWMNPKGLTTLVDALGGVTIKVDYKLYDKPCGPSGSTQQKLGADMAIPGNSVCGDTTHWGYFVPTGPSGVNNMKAQAAQYGGLTVVQVPGHDYDVGLIIAPGTYHMNGDWALAYARTRIYDPYLEFGRSARQQNFMSSLRKQLDPCHFASVENVLPLLGAVQAIPQGFNTDMDVTNAQNLRAWAGIAKNVLGDNVQQLNLTPQLVGMPGKETWIGWDPSSTLPKVRSLVQEYFDKSMPSSSPGANSGSSC
jgi:anionic cell wall polymer biosynthesis LytR-Cps2A-Psr (LCP) family protein